MNKIFSTLVGTSVLAIGSIVTLAPQVLAFTMVPSTDEIEKYLIVGNEVRDAGIAVDVSNTELGADRQVLSDGSSVPNSQGTASPNTLSVFYQGGDRWKTPGNPDSALAADIFEGIDWTGNVAVTSSEGQFNMSNVDLYADIGVQCADTVSDCISSVSNTNYFPDQSTTSAGSVGSGAGVTGNVNFVDGLPADAFIDAEKIEKQNRKDGSGPLVTDLDLVDTTDIGTGGFVKSFTGGGNNDGIAVIDIINGKDTFNLDDSDWILNSTEDRLAIVRVKGATNFNISNSSILLGRGYVEGDPISYIQNQIGAIFVKTGGESVGSTDEVFNFNNVVLNGIGIWDLVTVDDTGKTQSVFQNGQGCGSFIGSQQRHSNVRWNRCATPVPEPLTILGSGLALGFAVNLKRKLGKSQKSSSPLAPF